MLEHVKKKMMDREASWEELPPSHRRLYEEAEIIEWVDWRTRGSVRICSGADSELVRRAVEEARIIGLRCVYREKNASI